MLPQGLEKDRISYVTLLGLNIVLSNNTAVCVQSKLEELTYRFTASRSYE